MDIYMQAIVGVSALGLLIDVILPRGEVQNYVKKVFGIVIVVVVCMPIVNFLGGDFSLDEIIYGDGYEIDKNYVHTVNNLRADTVENYFENFIKDEGYECSVNCDISTGRYHLEIIFQNDVLNGSEEHINIIEKVYDLASYLCGSDKDEVIIRCLSTS